MKQKIEDLTREVILERNHKHIFIQNDERFGNLWPHCRICGKKADEKEDNVTIIPFGPIF